MNMASIAGYYLRRRVCQISVQLSHSNIKCLRRSRGIQWFSSGTESHRTEFAGENAYDLLGVSETSSFAEIKASFRKLAKETHPDLVEPKSDSAASQRFVKILAAYEILSDSGKRAHYDMYLLSQRRILEKHSVKGTRLWSNRSQITTFKQMEVVEWLKWYRYAINDIVPEKRVVVGTGYFDVLERDFYSAIHAAYYGPIIESMDLLPDRFEAEERSVYETPEVLHLVSGRDLFGIVRLVNEIPQISFACNEKLSSLASIDSGICPTFQNRGIHMSSGNGDNFGTPMMQSWNSTEHTSDAYKDLELHVSGKVVAVASRYPPKNCCDGRKKEDAGDKIHVFLSTHGYQSMDTIDELPTGHFSCGAVRSKIPLGTITGLGTSPDEGSCFVYDSNGTKTHVIMKHRTLLVKHMHWYPVQEEVSVCECRCSRARLPPSKFWLFEPRCGMHDIGGWYIETFGRDKKGRTVPSQRYWDGFDASQEFEKRLHPAMYLLALAYRTLDLEDAKRRKRTVKDVIEGQLFRILHWCKNIV